MTTSLPDGYNIDGVHLTERDLLEGLKDIHNPGLFALVANMFHHQVALENRVAELEARLAEQKPR